MSKWQPIATRRDGTDQPFLAYDEANGIYVAQLMCVDEDGPVFVCSVDLGTRRPTHWTDLPAPPALSKPVPPRPMLVKHGAGFWGVSARPSIRSKP